MSTIHELLIDIVKGKIYSQQRIAGLVEENNIKKPKQTVQLLTTIVQSFRQLDSGKLKLKGMRNILERQIKWIENKLDQTKKS